MYFLCHRLYNSLFYFCTSYVGFNIFTILLVFEYFINNIGGTPV